MARRDWLGVREKRWTKGPNEEIRPAKTLWDWLQLAVVPLAVTVIALLFNSCQGARDRERDERRAGQDRAIAGARASDDRRLAQEVRRDETLQSYVVEMSGLILDRRLLRAQPGSVVRTVARTLTLTTFRRLDGLRRTEALRFLADSGLIDSDGDRYSMVDGDHFVPRELVAPTVLSGADLRGIGPIDLRVVDLSDTDLRNADFSGTDGFSVDLDRSRMNGASFDDAFLAVSSATGADLRDARFRNADLVNIDLRGACLTGASFAGANLRYADLREAEGSGVDFRRAKLGNVKIAGSAIVNPRLDGATRIPRAWREARPSRASASKGDCGTRHATAGGP